MNAVPNDMTEYENRRALIHSRDRSAVTAFIVEILVPVGPEKRPPIPRAAAFFLTTQPCCHHDTSPYI